MAPRLKASDSKLFAHARATPSTDFDWVVTGPPIKSPNRLERGLEVGVGRGHDADVELVHDVSADEVDCELDVDPLLHGFVGRPVSWVSERTRYNRDTRLPRPG